MAKDNVNLNEENVSIGNATNDQEEKVLLDRKDTNKKIVEKLKANDLFSRKQAKKIKAALDNGASPNDAISKVDRKLRGEYKKIIHDIIPDDERDFTKTNNELIVDSPNEDEHKTEVPEEYLDNQKTNNNESQDSVYVSATTKKDKNKTNDTDKENKTNEGEDNPQKDKTVKSGLDNNRTVTEGGERILSYVDSKGASFVIGLCTIIGMCIRALLGLKYPNLRDALERDESARKFKEHLEMQNKEKEKIIEKEAKETESIDNEEINNENNNISNECTQNNNTIEQVIETVIKAINIKADDKQINEAIAKVKKTGSIDLFEQLYDKEQVAKGLKAFSNMSPEQKKEIENSADKNLKAYNLANKKNLTPEQIKEILENGDEEELAIIQEKDAAIIRKEDNITVAFIKTDNCKGELFISTPTFESSDKINSLDDLNKVDIRTTCINGKKIDDKLAEKTASMFDDVAAKVVESDYFEEQELNSLEQEEQAHSYNDTEDLSM